MAATSRKTKGMLLILGLESSLKNLSLSSSAKPKATQTPIVDSWEEAASDQDDDNGTSTPSTPSSPSTPLANRQTPGPPPPTPSSPTHFRKKSTDWADFPTSYNYPTNGAPTSPPPRSTAFASADKRPEKSSAAAGRMIAGALGVKAPKKTEEGRAYERAAREKEMRRRERAKEEDARAEREREEARRAVWDG